MEVAPRNATGKSSRACDGCVRSFARWYCAADDAFLCHSCDSSVHSANPLAKRHERIRLNTACSLAGGVAETVSCAAPSWVKSCKRKARTPRPVGGLKMKVQAVVPDLVETSPCSLEEGQDEEQLMYRVPVFDPVVSEFCGGKQTLGELSDCIDSDAGFAGFVPSERELAEFTANMESLLNYDGLDDGQDDFFIEKLGLVEPIEITKLEKTDEKTRWDENEEPVELELDVSKDGLELGFDWESPEEVGEQKFGDARIDLSAVSEEQGAKKKAKLSLDYEAVIVASSLQGLLPWTDGQKPDFSLDDNVWPDYSGMWSGGVQGKGEKVGIVGDGEREARVTRYREKRRMRLFSKKIRYEVRKLNAEKRPRMKGRFVKRTPGLTFAH